MNAITSAEELKDAIRILEVEHSDKGQILKKQLLITFESMKPVNMLMSTLDDVASSPYLIDNIIGSILGITSGFISKKIFIGASGNKFRKLMGYVLQFGVTNFVSRHHDTIKSLGQNIFQVLLSRKRQT